MGEVVSFRRVWHQDTALPIRERFERDDRGPFSRPSRRVHIENAGLGCLNVQLARPRLMPRCQVAGELERV